MAKLIYSAKVSLDGFVEDADGEFRWARPDEEVHEFVNELERPIGTYLYGRRMYETMLVWETADGSGEPPVLGEYAELWRDADKIVYSRTLQEARSGRTRIEREFDSEAVGALKESAAADIAVGGAELSGQALTAGLVDEIHLLLCPITVGSGKPALPHDARCGLELINERRFQSGVVHVSYRVTGVTRSDP